MAEESAQPVFNIEKIYVKDLSLELPNAPEIFLERENPQIDVQLNTRYQNLNEGLYETTLRVTITAKLADKTMFLVEATQGGIFQIRNIPESDIEPVLEIACPNILFPYVREVVSDVVVRAGFPPVLLNPMNFEAVYQQRRAQNEAEAAPVTH